MSRTIRWCCAATLLFAAAFAPTGVSAQMGVQQVSPQTDGARASPTGLTARVVKTAGSFGNQMQESESSKQKWLGSLVGTNSELVAVLC
jgi:hypothetical protein